MHKTGLKYAVASGILLGLTSVVSFLLGVNPFISLSQLALDIFIFALLIYFAMREFRQYENDDILHFWQGMTIGFFVYVGAVVLYVVVMIIWVTVDDNVLLDYQQQALQFLMDKSQTYIEQFGQEQFESQKQAIGETTVISLVLSSGVKKIVTGLFITPVISIFLRKKPI